MIKLIIPENNIESLSEILDSSTIIEIDLGYNKISNIAELNYLSHLQLQSINLSENPISSTEYIPLLEDKFPGIEIDRVDYDLY